MIYISTIKARKYNSLTIPEAESLFAATTFDKYGVSKALAEKKLLSLAERHGLRLTIIRPAKIYAHLDDGFLNVFFKSRHLLKFFDLSKMHSQKEMVSIETYNSCIVDCLTSTNTSPTPFELTDDFIYTPADIFDFVCKFQNSKPARFKLPRFFSRLIDKALLHTGVFEVVDSSHFIDRSGGQTPLSKYFSDWKM